MLVTLTLILSGCSEKLDDYSNNKLFYLETIGWESSMEDVLRLNSKSNNIRAYLNVRGLERENDHMIFQNIIYNGIEGYVSYHFYNDNKLYLVEYALLENKGDEKYENNPRYLSEDKIIELSKKKEKYKTMDFELDYTKLVDYIYNKENDIIYNDEIIIWYNYLKNKYGDPNEIIMPKEDNLEIRILWDTQDTNISLIARKNGLAGERRDLIVRYYQINK